MTAEVLFSLSDTGRGHRSVTLALCAGLDEISNGQVRYHIDDLLDRSGLPLLGQAPAIYARLTRGFVGIYNAVYVLTNSKRIVSILARLAYRVASRNVDLFLRELDPRLIVVTHPVLVSHLICKARREHRFSFRVVTVITDPVSFHASWVCNDVDRFIVFSESAQHKLQEFGISADQISVTSFPVQPQFSAQCLTKRAARRSLNISNELFTVLLTGGGAGAGIAPMLIDVLMNDPSLQVLIVTGGNRRLFEGLSQSICSRNVHVYEQIDNMPVLMAACDVVVTKAGPTTIMEAAASHRPSIVTGAVGLQEVGNIGLALEYGLCLYCTTTLQVADALRTIREGHFSGQPNRPLKIGYYEPSQILLNELEMAYAWEAHA